MHPIPSAIAFLFIGLLLAPPVFAIQLVGETYDGIQLTTLKNVRVLIDTSPAQESIASDGRYSFDVEPGTYTLRASYIEQGIETMNTQARIQIPAGEGSYSYNLILLPPLENTNQQPLPAEAEWVPDITKTLQQPLSTLLIIGLLLLGWEAAIIITRKNKSPVPEFSNQIAEINESLPPLPLEKKKPQPNKKQTHSQHKETKKAKKINTKKNKREIRLKK